MCFGLPKIEQENVIIADIPATITKINLDWSREKL